MSTATTAARTPWAKVTGVAALVSLVVGLIVLAFSWPGITANPHDVPVGIVGSGPQAEAIKTAVTDKSDGALKLTTYDSRDDAVAAIERRESYGAIILPAESTAAPEVLKATAASPQVAQLMTGLAEQLQTQVDAQIKSTIESTIAQQQEAAAAAMKAALAAAASGQQPQVPEASGTPFELPTVTVTVTDIAPYTARDPRGAGLSAAMFPLIIGGIAGGVALSLMVKGRRRRLTGVVLYSAFSGLVLGGILQGWFGALQGNFALNAAALALAIGSISALVTGLFSLLGMPGVPIAVLLLFFLGNPLSGAAIPAEFVAGPWGYVGQWLPPGAAVTLIRNLSYFPDANNTFPWLVLTGWFVLGVFLTIAGHARAARSSSNTAVADSADAELAAA